MEDLTAKTVPPDSSEIRFLERPPKGDGIEIFPGRFLPEAGERVRIARKEKFPLPEHFVTEHNRSATQQDHIHTVGTQGVAGRLDILHEIAGCASGSGGLPFARQ
jgi:hypothetical protein